MQMKQQQIMQQQLLEEVGQKTKHAFFTLFFNPFLRFLRFSVWIASKYLQSWFVIVKIFLTKSPVLQHYQKNRALLHSQHEKQISAFLQVPFSLLFHTFSYLFIFVLTFPYVVILFHTFSYIFIRQHHGLAWGQITKIHFLRKSFLGSTRGLWGNSEYCRAI